MPGLYFEEFHVGQIFDHAIRRTVTEADNTLFCCMTHNTQPLHIDHQFAAGTEWKKPLVNSLFTLGLMIGISVSDLTVGTTIANLGMTDVRFPSPLFEGDTVRCTTEIAGKRESKSRPTAGLVTVRTRVKKTDGTVVCDFERTILVAKRGHAVEDRMGY